MINFYSGTPGSGKSLDMAHEICEWLKMKKNVITNTPINRNAICRNPKKLGRVYNIDNYYITPEFLLNYAKKFHKQGKENQTLLVLDEAQILFAPNTVKLKCQEDKFYREKWLKFFTQHRKYGFNIIIVSQFDKLIDAQIRCLFEYNVIHRKANNFGMIGSLLTIFHIPLFVRIEYWYGVNQICSKRFFTYKKKFSKIYDTYGSFE